MNLFLIEDQTLPSLVIEYLGSNGNGFIVSTMLCAAALTISISDFLLPV
jgi:Na+/proline symporter